MAHRQPAETEKAPVKAKHLLDKDHVPVLKLMNQSSMLGGVARILCGANVNTNSIDDSAMGGSVSIHFVVRIAESDIDRIKNALKDL